MNRILLICFGSTPQVLSVTPAVAILRRNFPKAAITILAPRGKTDIFTNNPSVTAVWPHQGFAAQLKQVKATNFDLAIIFNTSFKYSLLTFLAGIKKRIAPHKFYTDSFITNPVKQPLLQDGPLHQIFINMLAPLFVFTVPLTPKLFVSKKENEWAQKYLQNLGLTQGEKFVCINPSSPLPHLNWPKENYAAFIDKVAMEYPSLKIVIICHNKQEVSTAQEIYWRSIRKPYIIQEDLPLINFIALLNRAAVVISNYNAPAHIAAALDKPVISFFPPLDSFEILRPYAQNLVLLQTMRDKCKKCNNNTCLQYCMRDISVEAALKAFDTIAKKIIKGSNKVLRDDTLSFFGD